MAARPRFRLTAVPDHAIFENREFEGPDLTVRAFSISGDLAFVHVNDREVGGGLELISRRQTSKLTTLGRSSESIDHRVEMQETRKNTLKWT